VDRLFLDANILFSVAYRPDSGLRRLWQLANVSLVTSLYAVEEARRNLTQPVQRAALQQLLSTVQLLTVTPDTPGLPCSVELPEKDLPILAAAISARATHLLTGDMRDFGRYYGQCVEGVLILPPAEYLRRLGAV